MALPDFEFLLSTPDTGQVRLPPLLLVLFRSLNGIRSRVDTTAGNNKVRTTADCRLGSLILLAQLVTLRREVHTGSEDDKVFILVGTHTGGNVGQSAGGNEAQHETLVFACVVDGGRGVITRSEGALGGHFGENEETAVRTVGEVGGLGSLGQSLDNTLSGKNGTVDNVRPFGDAECTAVVLLLYSVANVDKFAVLKDEEVVLLSEGLEAIDGLGTKVGEDVNMGFDNGNVGTEAC